MRLFDAHNHLMDGRFAGSVPRLVAEARAVGVAGMVVNGACADDWPDVERRAAEFPEVVPSYGLHPWYVPTASDAWKDGLRARLEADPRAAVGEIGIDRWILGQSAAARARYHPDLAAFEPAPLDVQCTTMTWQLALAAELGRPASIHCLQAYGTLLELLQSTARPDRGFLLHSYGGPVEMVPQFVQLGAYFGFPGYFLHDRKERQREPFRHIPADRLLVETDAPDQPLPDSHRTHEYRDPDGKEWNHPANLRAVYEGLAAVRAEPVEALAATVGANFRRLFGQGALKLGAGSAEPGARSQMPEA